VADLVGEVIGKIVTFLGWDGVWFRPVHVDAAGDLQVDAITCALPAGAATAANQALILAEVAEHTPLDRNPVDRSSGADVAYTSHAVTTRYTYTVGAGKKALLMSQFGRTGSPAAGRFTEVRIQVNDYYTLWIRNLSTTTTDRIMKGLPCAIWLDAGYTVKVTTVSTDPAAVWFEWAVHIVEFT